MTTVKVYKDQLYRMFVDAQSAYGKEEFSDYIELLERTSTSIPMQWITNDATGISHLTFVCGETTIWVHYYDQVTRKVFVDQLVLDRVKNDI